MANNVCRGVLFVFNPINVNTILNIQFSGGIYGLMLVGGYLVWKQYFRKYSCKLLATLGILAYTFTVGIQFFSYQYMQGYNVWYNCVTLVICSLIIFELGSRIKDYPFKSIIYDLSKCSFGIYLVHNPILLIVKKYLPVQCMMPIKVILLWLLVLALSWFIVYWVNKIPRIGKYLFFIR